MKARLFTRQIVWGEWKQYENELSCIPVSGEYLRLPNNDAWYEIRAVVRLVDDPDEVEADVYAILVDRTMVLKGL
jgi:hypothetical protein